MVDCSKMQKCHLIFEDCPELSRIKSVGTSVHDDPTSSGYASVTLNSLPKRDIELEGGIHSIEISCGDHKLRSGLGGAPLGSSIALSTEEVAENGRICINNPKASEIQDVEHIAVIFQGEDNPEEVLVADGSDVRFIGLMGGRGIKRLRVNCRRGASRVSIEGMMDLESVEIIGSTQVLDIRRCPAIKRVHGHGNSLTITDEEYQDIKYVQLSGLWLSSPPMAIASPSGLTLDEILTCNDLEFACFSTLEYISACEIEEELGLNVTFVKEPFSPHLHIPSFVDAMSQNLHLVPRLTDWFPSLPLLQDHYYMMRIITALSHNGADRREASGVRKHVLHQNLNNAEFSPHYFEKFVSPRMVEKGSSRIFPIEVEENDANSKFLGSYTAGTMEDLHQRAISGKNEWSDDPRPWKFPGGFSFIPLEVSDLEMWMASGSEDDLEIPQVHAERHGLVGWMGRKKDRERGFGDFSRWISQVLPSILSDRPCADCLSKMESLSERIFEMVSRMNGLGWLPDTIRRIMPNFLDKVSFHLSDPFYPPSPFRDQFEEKFIQFLRSTDLVSPREKAAVAYGILQHDTGMSLKWKLLIKGLINDLPIGEASRLRAPSIGGSRVFKDGLAQSLSWPYVENWRLDNDLR